MTTALGIFGNLPIEIVQHIATFWSKEEAYTCAQTSKKLNELLCNFKILQYSEFWQKIQRGVEKYFPPTPTFHPTQLFEEISFQHHPMNLEVTRPKEILSSMIPTDQTTLKTLGKEGRQMARLFVTRTGCPVKWIEDIYLTITHYFSIVQRLSPYPSHDTSGLFANYEMEQWEPRRKCFLVPPEKQASLCVGELFYLLSENRKDFSFEEGLLFNGNKWGLLEYEIAGAICARLIDPIDSSKFTQFFNKIDKESQETVIVKAARALTIGYNKEPRDEGLPDDQEDQIIQPNFGLFTFFLRSIKFKTRLPQTQLALIKILIRVNSLEALSALEEMQEGPAKNAARVEMIYYFWRVLLVDTNLPIEQQGRNFAKLIREARDIPEEVLHKRVGRVLFRYLTLLANQPPPLLDFRQMSLYSKLLPRWGDEDLCRMDALSRLGDKMVELFKTGLAPIPTHEEIFEFFGEAKPIDYPGKRLLLPMYAAFFPYFTTEEGALQGLDFIFSSVLDDRLSCGILIWGLARNWRICPPVIRHSSRCLLKIVDIMGGTNGYKREKAIKYTDARCKEDGEEEAANGTEDHGIDQFLLASLRGAREAEVLVKMIQLAKQRKMIDLYPNFLSRFKDFSESEAFKEELISFLLMEDLSPKSPSYRSRDLGRLGMETLSHQLTSYWRLLFKKLGKEEGLRYVRRIQSPQERDRALLGIIKNHKDLIEDQIFSLDELVKIAEEFTDLELGMTALNLLFPDPRQFADQFAEDFFVELDRP